MADALKTGRQRMQQETANKLFGGNRHRAGFSDYEWSDNSCIER